MLSFYSFSSVSRCIVFCFDQVFFSFVIPPVSEWGDIIDEMSDRMANQPSLIRKFAKER